MLNVCHCVYNLHLIVTVDLKYINSKKKKKHHSKTQMNRGVPAQSCFDCKALTRTSHFSLAEITHKGVGQMVSVLTSCWELAESKQYHSVKTAARSEPPSEENTCLQYRESLRDTT